MDTRFWGPSGWKLLHMITFDYTYSPTNAITYAQFFESLPYILPCKFCRSSLGDYYKQYPYKTYVNINPNLDLKKWLYNIHNCVNDKLRSQGLHPTPNPSYADVKKIYECEMDINVIWDFLFAVAYHHPKNVHSDPMPKCPKNIYKCKDKCEKNKWNVLSVRDRIYWFKRFWKFLPVVLPERIATKWKNIKNPPTLESRHSTLEWLWRVRCGIDSSFKDPYTSICKKVISYSTDCDRKNAITCRKTQNPIKISKTLRKKRKKTTK